MFAVEGSNQSLSLLDPSATWIRSGRQWTTWTPPSGTSGTWASSLWRPPTRALCTPRRLTSPCVTTAVTSCAPSTTKSWPRAWWWPPLPGRTFFELVVCVCPWCDTWAERKRNPGCLSQSGGSLQQRHRGAAGGGVGALRPGGGESPQRFHAGRRVGQEVAETDPLSVVWGEGLPQTGKHGGRWVQQLSAIVVSPSPHARCVFCSTTSQREIMYFIPSYIWLQLLFRFLFFMTIWNVCDKP